MKIFLRRILYWISMPIWVLCGFNKGVKLYYLKNLQWEKELGNVFALLLFGSYIGLSNLSIGLRYRRLPCMIEEMCIMRGRFFNSLIMKMGWLNV